MRALAWYLFFQNPSSRNWYTGLKQVTGKGGRPETKEAEGWSLTSRIDELKPFLNCASPTVPLEESRKLITEQHGPGR